MLQIGRHDFGVQTVAYAAETGGAEFFHLDNGIKLVGIKATIGLGLGHAQKTQGPRFDPDRLIHIALLLPSRMVGSDFSSHETAKAVAKGLMLRAE